MCHSKRPETNIEHQACGPADWRTRQTWSSLFVCNIRPSPSDVGSGCATTRAGGAPTTRASGRGCKVQAIVADVLVCHVWAEPPHTPCNYSLRVQRQDCGLWSRADIPLSRVTKGPWSGAFLAADGSQLGRLNRNSDAGDEREAALGLSFDCPGSR